MGSQRVRHNWATNTHTHHSHDYSFPISLKIGTKARLFPQSPRLRASNLSHLKFVPTSFLRQTCPDSLPPGSSVGKRVGVVLVGKGVFPGHSSVMPKEFSSFIGPDPQGLKIQPLGGVLPAHHTGSIQSSGRKGIYWVDPKVGSECYRKNPNELFG